MGSMRYSQQYQRPVAVMSFGTTVSSITTARSALLLTHSLTYCGVQRPFLVTCPGSRTGLGAAPRTWFFHVVPASFRALSLLSKNNQLYSLATYLFFLVYSGEGRKPAALLTACSISVPPAHGSAPPFPARWNSPMQRILGLMDAVNQKPVTVILVSPDQVPGNQDTTLQSVFSGNWVSLSGSFAGVVCQGVQVKDR